MVTIKDIASRLKISVSTVSRALHDHPDISRETREQVKSLANELDYQPYSVAQSLKKKQTKTIGVLLPEIKHDFFSAALDGIEEVTYGAGFTILVSKSNECYEREVLNTRALVSNRVAGLIVSISQNTKDIQHFKSLIQRNVPIVFFDRVPDTIAASKVVVNDREVAFQAMEHLIESGYKRIAHFAGPKHLSVTRERFEGYKMALEKYNMPLNKHYVIHGGLQEDDGMSAFQKLLQLKELPEAIFAINDPVAIGAIAQIKEHNLKIPGDIALVGFSDNPIASLIDPPLTTVAQPAYEMGVAAARLLLEEIEHSKEGTIISRTEKLKTKLVIRKSTYLTR